MRHSLRVLACAFSAAVLFQPVRPPRRSRFRDDRLRLGVRQRARGPRRSQCRSRGRKRQHRVLTYTADLALELEYTRWRYAFVTTTKGVRSGERYAISAGADYKFGEGVYWLVDATREHDRFGAFARRTVVSTGLWQAVQRLCGLFEWPFSESRRFDQELLVELGGGNAHIESTSALRSRLTDALA